MPDILYDKFYTPDATARKCVGTLWRTLGMQPDDLFIEPSAGAGAFCRHLPADRLIALDIAPEGGCIATGDFFDFVAPGHAGRCIVIGNPPFGRNGALARAFLRHAMGFADIVAFILPASFAKPSLQRGIDRRFHLVHQSSLAGQPFETSDGSHVVNTVFQIWEKRNSLREDTPEIIGPSDFAFVHDIRDADLVIRRVGTRAGAVLEMPAMIADGILPAGYASSSNYYIKAVGCDPLLLEHRLTSLDLARHAQYAVCPSLSKRDLVAAYVEAYGQEAPAAVPVHLTITRKASIRASALACNDPALSTKAIHVIFDHTSMASLPERGCRMNGAGGRLEPPDVSLPESQPPEKRGCKGKYHIPLYWNAAPPEPPPLRRTVWHGIYPQPPDRRPHVSSPANDPCRGLKRVA